MLYKKENSKRRELELLRSELDQDRSTFKSHWRDLADYNMPRRQRFFVSDVNRGDRKNQKIINSTSTLAARTLRAGMVGGITSPARQWFRLGVANPEASEIGAVKGWLDIVTKRMTTVLLKSNFYNVAPIAYGDLGVFGTAAVLCEEDFQDVIRFYPFPIGSYMLSNNSRLKVDVFFREFRMTIRQLVEKFGESETEEGIKWDKFSTHVKNAWDRDLKEGWVDVCHVIRPNPNYDPKKSLSKYKKYESVYYEKGYGSGSNTAYLSSRDYDKYLSEKGYDLFPVLAPRWEITGEDVYGTNCPGMVCLGDVKALQTMEKRAAQAIEKGVNPPMVAPTSMKSVRASILPGDITYADIREGQQGFRPAHEINFQVGQLHQMMDETRQRISRSYYEDLFLMLANSDRRQVTATEIEARHEEKLLALGPVLEQLNQDFLDPLIDIVFDVMNRQGLIPPPPKEIQGADLKVEYISIMAQAQKLLGIGSIDRFTQYSANLMGVNPNIGDKIDFDQLIDVYGDLTGVSPGIVRPDEEVQKIREQKAKAAAAQAQIQAQREQAATAKDLSQADVSGDNALNRLIQQGNAGRLA